MVNTNVCMSTILYYNNIGSGKESETENYYIVQLHVLIHSNFKIRK